MISQLLHTDVPTKENKPQIGFVCVRRTPEVQLFAKLYSKLVVSHLGGGGEA
jgi:hypothetical protein